MAISGISSQFYVPQTSSQTAKQTGNEVIDEFLAYMKESPAQHMRDQWLKEHNLTEAQLAAMPPAERDAINKQIAADLKKKFEQQVQKKLESEAGISF
jgi:hypothetical protein